MLFIVLFYLMIIASLSHSIGRSLVTALCRSVVYAFLTRGRGVPLHIVLSSAVFCSLNGFLQGHHLLHCVPEGDPTWLTGARRVAGVSGGGLMLPRVFCWVDDDI